MESTGLRRKDTTKGPPLRILSLDGGGVRGYSMLILLQELMHRTYVECEGKAPRRDQIPKPCDYFDLIAGTGTGGLIAIMLGRLRLDLETCKEVYVRMTRKVFETDKTIAGIPYRSTLFKASKLEDAIRECVREHTIFEDEGNDGTERGGREPMLTPSTPANGMSEQEFKRQSVGSTVGFSPVSTRSIVASMRWGNPNAYLYDSRENRTKTAVAAVYKGTKKGGGSVLLRSYDSRKEPAPEFNCTIWQAGRATSATGLAFKPIQIGQSVFIDEGAGNYNPAPQIMDEAAVNEYPGRDIGVFMSIGTGKRPGGTNHKQHEWWEGFVGGGMGDFAEARRRLMSKIEGCEDTHQYMRNEHLAKRGVNPENYYRLNVEVGVGEFGMNEWNRLADISTSTRRYVAKSESQRIIQDAGTKMAKIERAKRRYNHYNNTSGGPDVYGEPDPPQLPPPELPPLQNPLAVELPGDEAPSSYTHPLPPQYHSHSVRHHQHNPNHHDNYPVAASDEFPQVVEDVQPRRSGETPYPIDDHRTSNYSIPPSPRRSYEDHNVRTEAPPLPPKTPIGFVDRKDMARMHIMSPQSPKSPRLPYPDTDGPPPMVNMARKPEFMGR